MVLAYGVLSTGGSVTRCARAWSNSLRRMNVARSRPSFSMIASSASSHSLVSIGSRSGGSTAQWPEAVRSVRSVMGVSRGRAMTPQADSVALRDVLDGDMLLPIAKHRVSFAVSRSEDFEIKCCDLSLSRHEI